MKKKVNTSGDTSQALSTSVTKTEDRIQSDFIQGLWNDYPRTRGLCYHIPNGGLRTQREAVTLRAMGVVAGIPDIHLAIAACGYNSLYIEFKTSTARMNTDHVKQQEKIHEALRSAGHLVHVCTSTEQAHDLVMKYLYNTYWIAE